VASLNTQSNTDASASYPYTQIYVVGAGKTFVLHVNLMQNVKSVKQIISDKTGIPVEKQRIVANCISLDTYAPLASYGIEKESTLFLTQYIIGGMPRKKKFRYCEAVLVHETYAPDDYDRGYKDISYTNESSNASNGYASSANSYASSSSSGYNSSNSYASSGYDTSTGGGYYKKGGYNVSSSTCDSYSKSSSNSYNYNIDYSSGGYNSNYSSGGYNSNYSGSSYNSSYKY
jgi:hypothetical protein